MDIIVPHAAALDVHNKTITDCVRTPDGHGGRSEQVRTFQTFLDGLVDLRRWLLAARVAQVAMEATSSYWLPVWRVLEDGEAFERLLLVNARHVKHVPGRKTDVKDATWLCQLLEVGLLAGSFVPPPDIRRLRTVTRYRKRLIQTRTSEIQRVEKTLEDAVVKIGSVASKTLTKSGRAMIDALIAGERDRVCSPSWPRAGCAPRSPSSSGRWTAASRPTTRFICASCWTTSTGSSSPSPPSTTASPG